MQQETISFAVGDGEGQGRLARPEGGGPGVLLLHAWWGLNPFFETLCGRFAEAGFVTLAPDVYGGPVANTVEEAEQLASGGDAALRLQTVRAAADALIATPGRTGSKIGVVGFSLGAMWAVQLAAHAPETVGAVVLYYGAVIGDFEQSAAAYLGHFGAEDAWEPPENVRAMEDALRAAGRDVTVHLYPDAGHWFCEADRPDAFQPEAAARAWERTVSFLHQRI